MYNIKKIIEEWDFPKISFTRSKPQSDEYIIEEMMNKTREELARATMEMKRKRTQIQMQAQLNQYTTITANPGSRSMATSGYITTTGGATYADGSGLSMPSWNYMDSFHTEKVKYTSHLYNILYTGVSRNIGDNDKFILLDSCVGDIMRKGDKSMIASLIVEKPLNILNKMVRIVSSESFLAEARNGLIIGVNETKKEFQADQTVLNSILNQYVQNETNIIYTFNVAERNMLMPDIQEMHKIVELIVSGDKGNFNVGKELLKNHANVG